MSALITWEWGFLLASMMWGMILAAGYDIIRVFRRVAPHRGILWIFVEDIVFWMCSGFIIFHVTFMINDGAVRSFSLLGFALGAVIYRFATNGWLVENVAKAINFILKPLKILFKYITIGLGRCCSGFRGLCHKVKVKINEKVRNKAGKKGET